MRPVRPVVVCALVLLAAGQSAADSYRDPAWHFTLDLPDGWERMSDDEVATLNTVVRTMTRSEEAVYETGFRPKGTDPGNYPHVLLQKIPGEIERATYAEIRKGFSKAFRMPVKAVEGTAAEPSLGTAVLDKSRNRVAVMDKFKAPGVGPVRALTVGHLGESGVVFVHCYAEEDRFAKEKPTFDKLNDAFRYDLGYEFQPAGAEPAKAKSAKDSTGDASAADDLPAKPSLAVSLGVGGGVTVVVGLVLWLAFRASGAGSRRGRPRRGDVPMARRTRRRSAYD